MHSRSSGLFSILSGTWDLTTLLMGIFLGISGFLGVSLIDKAVTVWVSAGGAWASGLESVVGVGSWVCIFFFYVFICFDKSLHILKKKQSTWTRNTELRIFKLVFKN